MTTEQDILQVTPRVEALADLCRRHDQIDAQLMAWLEEARTFARSKR